ncbi:MAG: flagellar basal body P-ring formation chaperone FlgA [Pirellulales bacterium]
MTASKFAGLVAILVLAQFGFAQAGDQVVLRFLDEPQTSDTVVKLKDIVEVVSGSSPSFDKLKEMSLGPAPRVGQVQTWHSSDVMQHLELRNVHPQSVRWSGSSSTKLHGVKSLSNSQVDSIVPAFTNETVISNATANVATAIREYLNLQTRKQVDWRIRPRVSPQHAKLLQSRRNILKIGGGEDPWMGEQEFVLQVRSGNQTTTLRIVADVETPPMIVVAKGPIRRDQILNESMLTFAPLPMNQDETSFFSDIKLVVGKQLRKSLSSSQPITDDSLADPVVVQRGQLVEVESIAGAVVVKTSGKSLSSGSVGELVDVELSESNKDRRKLKATVVGTGRVRIAAASFLASDR